jgi:hypothetical protein
MKMSEAPMISKADMAGFADVPIAVAASMVVIGFSHGSVPDDEAWS